MKSTSEGEKGDENWSWKNWLFSQDSLSHLVSLRCVELEGEIECRVGMEKRFEEIERGCKGEGRGKSRKLGKKGLE